MPLATYELPVEGPGAGSNPFTDFSGGGYFYLDDRDRAIMPTTDRHVYVIAQTGEPGFERVADYDLNGPVTSDDKVISALPDWRGRIWFATVEGVVGWVNPKSGAIHSKDLGEPIGNSFAVDEKGSVYVVTDAALYRLRARKGKVREQWRREVSEHGAGQAGTDPGGLRDHSDPAGRRQAGRDRRQRRPRERPRVQARGPARRASGSSARSRCSRRARRRPTRA